LGIDRKARNANISNELSKKNIPQRLQLEILRLWAMLNSFNLGFITTLLFSIVLAVSANTMEYFFDQFFKS
jgi:hypothetical protein